MVGSRPFSWSSFFETLRSLRHRLDHVHRDADRPGLVGDGPGDRLANPPGRVGAELVAAAVLVLVDGPHQPGVAFLDQVKERQAAVAVLLGDRDDQPEVAAGELCAWPARTRGTASSSARPACAGSRGLERDPHQVLELFLKVGAVFLAAAAGAMVLKLEHQLAHPAGDLLQPLHQGLDLLGADRQLLDQVDRLATAALEVGQRAAGAGRRSRSRT